MTSANQTYLSRDEAVDVDRRNAMKWIAEHPEDYATLFIVAWFLSQFPIIGWPIRWWLRRG